MTISQISSLDGEIELNGDTSSHRPTRYQNPVANSPVETSNHPAFENKPSKLDFGIDDPVDFLNFFDESFADQVNTLYPWQVEIGEQFGSVKPTSKEPYKFVLCAANGSGKDAFVITPFSLWFICCKIKSLVIITSSSGSQLTTQTEKYIAALAHKVNAYTSENMGGPILKIRQRRITCTLSHSEIIMFATDEAAKAEGFHPTEANTEMAIIVNEAKSVQPEIYTALRKCTGFNYWIDVSTPGEPRGDFYNHWMSWPNKRRVTYYDCLKHQSSVEFEEDKRELREHDAHFLSKWLAEFAFVGGKYVVNQDHLKNLRNNIKGGLVQYVNLNNEIRIGIDIALSSNGDETVISAFRGNKQTHLITYRIKDATLLAPAINRDLLDKIKIKQTCDNIYVDDGGVGRGVIDILKRDGWINIHRVLNQSQAKNVKMFKNRGAEIWYKFSKLIEQKCLLLLDDNKLYEQIAGRKYHETASGLDKLLLESKRAMISKGLPSPDRADATVLALCNTNVNDLLDKINLIVESKEPETEQETITRLTRELGLHEKKEKGNGRLNFSLNSILSKRKFNSTLSKWSR